MPSASTKTEIRPSSEGQDAIKLALNVVEKKVRNLEKRKGKLDAYREKSSKGDTLDKDQQEAVEKYESVLLNLEFARELERQFKSINVDSEKLLKKQAKRDKIEKTAQEVKRMQELLQLQDVLNNMGSDDVRNDFMTGKQGAVTLSEENLNQLDELYKLVSPSREGETSYEDQLSAASEHLVNLLDSKDKTVLGTTYKTLRELISRISECGYFDNLDGATEQKEPVKATVEEDAESSGSEEYVTANTGDATDSQSTETPLSNEGPSDDPPAQTTLEPTDNQQSTLVDQSFFPQQTHQQQQQSVPSPFEAKRDFKEIVSSVQGNYNFLQESEIEDTPHMDPAVVAAHPMVPSIPHPADMSNGLTTQQYTALLNEQTQQQNEKTISQSWHSQVPPQESHQTAWGNQTYPQSINTSSKNYGQECTPDVPPAIPLPDQTVDDGQNKPQKFSMNVDAAVFQSMISTQSSQDSNEDGLDTQEQSQDANSSSGFGGNWNSRGSSWNNRGPPPRGGRGGRGGTGNGYNRGGRGGERGGDRGGYNNRGYNYRGNSRPQGFPPRDNNRPDSYQGLNGNSMNSGGFNKPRGGGGVRGGGPRGNSRGGSGPRGRGGFDGRNNFNNAQQSATV